MMGDYFIPIEIQGDLQNRADIFREDFVPKVSWRFIADARGKFIYIRRYMSDGSRQNLGRLRYSGDVNQMTFAIYKYKTEKYELKADFFGASHLDGTLEGALRAILEAYP